MSNFVRPGEAGHVIKSTRDPGPPTLREAIDGMDENIFEAARREQLARRSHQAAMIGSTAEINGKGWEAQANAEQLHWRAYLAAYRTWLSLHPELGDKPLGTRCAHGRDCTIDSPRVREAGADDDVPAPRPPMIWDDSRLPPERDDDQLPLQP